MDQIMRRNNLPADLVIRNSDSYDMSVQLLVTLGVTPGVRDPVSSTDILSPVGIRLNRTPYVSYDSESVESYISQLVSSPHGRGYQHEELIIWRCKNGLQIYRR